MSTTKQAKRNARRGRIRARVSGTAERPRLAVFRSNKHLYAQLIDDTKGVTLGHATSLKQGKLSSAETAQYVGTEIAAQAKKAGITEVVFDRGGFLFIGVVKAVAEAARAGGLKF